MSNYHDIYCVLTHHTPSSIMLTNQNFIFFVMLWWWYFVPLLKLSPHTHTHTHMNTKIKKFILGQTVAILATHRNSYIQEATSNLCMHLHTQTY